MKNIKKYETFSQKPVKIAFCGDLLIHQPVIDYEAKRKFSFDGVFDEIMPIFSLCDAVVINVEGTFNGEPSAAVKNGIPKFSMPDELATVLFKSGVTHATLANNHAYDFGEDGFERTKKILEDAGIKYIAGELDCKINSIEVSFRSFTTHTNVNAPENSPILSVSKPRDSAMRIALPHWGGQFNGSPDEEQQEEAQELLDMGFDAIMGSGPHVSHDVVVEDCVVAYSLGNLISDHQKSGRLDTGSIVVLTVNGSITAVEEYKIKTISDNGKLVLQVVGYNKFRK